jgi:membrane protease YdiL (CAAX protease family)
MLHLVAVYAILVAPPLGWMRYRRLLQAGFLDPGAKSRFYTRLVRGQCATLLALGVLWWLSGLPWSAVGVGPPHSWAITGALVVWSAAVLFWSALRLRRRAARVREVLKSRGGAILPDRPEQVPLFALACLWGGILEEFLYRGFMLDYLGRHIPRLTVLDGIILASLIFGLAHLYQGGRGVLTAGIVGLVLALAYVGTGSLVAPALIHVMGNLRFVVLAQPAGGPPAQGPARPG